MLARLARYLEWRWEFREYLADLRDTRQNPQIPTSAVVLSIFAMHALRLGSFNELEARLRMPGRWEPWVGSRKPSADTLGYSLARLDLSCTREIKVGGKIIIEYYYREVVLQMVGVVFALPLDAEPILKGETETAAALRLLRRVQAALPRFKQEERDLYKDEVKKRTKRERIAKIWVEREVEEDWRSVVIFPDPAQQPPADSVRRWAHYDDFLHEGPQAGRAPREVPPASGASAQRRPSP